MGDTYLFYGALDGAGCRGYIPVYRLILYVRITAILALPAPVPLILRGYTTDLLAPCTLL